MLEPAHKKNTRRFILLGFLSSFYHFLKKNFYFIYELFKTFTFRLRGYCNLYIEYRKMFPKFFYYRGNKYKKIHPLKTTVSIINYS